MAVDAAGDLYVADYENNRIQEVATSTGTQWGQSMAADDMYTVAGSSTGSSGYSGDGGPATSATISQPAGLAFDGSGDLFIGDTGNGAVRMVAAANESKYPGGADTVYTIAGNASGYGTAGDGGSAVPEGFLSQPSDEVVDAAGDVYVADQWNCRIQEVPATTGTQWGNSMIAGDIYTMAGIVGILRGTPATEGRLRRPSSTPVRHRGRLRRRPLYRRSGNNRVQEVAASTHSMGTSMTSDDIYTMAGSSSGTSGHTGDAGAATSALLDGP